MLLYKAVLFLIKPFISYQTQAHLPLLSHPSVALSHKPDAGRLLHLPILFSLLTLAVLFLPSQLSQQALVVFVISRVHLLAQMAHSTDSDNE